MRTTLSLIAIVFSVVAIGAGYLSGRSSIVPAHPAAALPAAQNVAMPAPAPLARSLRGAHSLDLAEDAPAASDEDAVVANDPSTGSLSENATIALIIAGTGRSLKLESPFLDLPVPLTVIVDPEADDAQAVAAAAIDRGKTVYVRLPASAQTAAPALKSAVDRYRRLFPAFSGIAVRFDADDANAQARLLARVLRGSSLGVLDLTGAGPVARALLSKADLHVRRRDVTIDNRDDAAYVKFMLTQAVQVARGRGGAVVVAHPYPQSFAALSRLVGNSGRDGVNFTAL